MPKLFEIEPDMPPGFTYRPDFISEDEEQKLLGFIGTLDLEVFRFQGFEAKRKVKSYGYDYHFDSRGLEKGEPIPEELRALIQKVSQLTDIAAEKFEEALVTEYPVGATFNWHRDAPPFGMIVGISLLSECSFRLRPHDKRLQSRKMIRTITLPPRSLYIMKEEARENWEHSMSAVKNKRYSITLRTVR